MMNATARGLPGTVWLLLLGFWTATQLLAVLPSRPDAERFSPREQAAAPILDSDPASRASFAGMRTEDVLARYGELQARPGLWDRLLGRTTATFEALEAPGVRAEYLRELWRRGECAFVRGECAHLLRRLPDLSVHDRVNLVLALGAINEDWSSEALAALLRGPHGRSWAGLHAAAFLEERFRHPFEPSPERVNPNTGAFDRWREQWLSWYDAHRNTPNAP